MDRRIDHQPAVEVFVNQRGGISIKTEDMGGDEVIALHPDQVPTVIKWLQECLDEIEQGVAIEE